MCKSGSSSVSSEGLQHAPSMYNPKIITPFGAEDCYQQEKYRDSLYIYVEAQISTNEGPVQNSPAILIVITKPHH